MDHRAPRLPRVRWRHLSLALVVLNVLTAGLAVWVDRRIAHEHQASQRASLAWSRVATDLTGVAGLSAGRATNDPSTGHAAGMMPVGSVRTDELATLRAAARTAHDAELTARAARIVDLRNLFYTGIALTMTMTALVAARGLRLVRQFRRDQQQTATLLDLLAASELRKTAVIGASLDAIIILDNDGRITDFNPAAERIFACTAAQVLGQPAIETIVPVSVRDNYRRGLARYLASGDARHLGRRIETTGLRADGSEFPVELTVTPARIGTDTCFTAQVRDITERQEQETALHRSNRELEQFAYVASHDLQEPLRMVSGYLALLEKRYRQAIDDKGREFISHAVDGAERMHALINDLLAYSRVDRGEAPQEAIDAEAALDEALEYLRPKLIECAAQVSREPLPIVQADRLQLVQLFQNLVGNAIKYRGIAAPHVHIGVERDGERFRISVQDNGIGIEPAHHERIFEIFQRLHTRAEYPGTGIGLAICKKIVERHGGQLWVESAKGAGSTFCFTLCPAGTAYYRLRREASSRSSDQLRAVQPAAQAEARA